MQRDKEVRVWGKAEPGEIITVQLDRTDADASIYQVQATADQAGAWQVTLPKNRAEGIWQLVIWGSSDAQKKIEIKDIVFGEVWVASGQSNMQWTVANSNNAKEEIANSGNDRIRMWTATRTVATEPAFDVQGSWAVASPETTGNFSAVAYYFARRLQQELDVPVGILHTSWGGTPVEAWTSREKLDEIDWAKPILQRYDAAVKAYPKGQGRPRQGDEALDRDAQRPAEHRIRCWIRQARLRRQPVANHETPTDLGAGRPGQRRRRLVPQDHRSPAGLGQPGSQAEPGPHRRRRHHLHQRHEGR